VQKLQKLARVRSMGLEYGNLHPYVLVRSM
jgi:hypothetical protein